METTAKESPPQIPIPIFEDAAGIHAASLNKDKAAQSVAWKKYEQNIYESDKGRPARDWGQTLKEIQDELEHDRFAGVRALDGHCVELIKSRRSWVYRFVRWFNSFGADSKRKMNPSRSYRFVRWFNSLGKL